MHRMKTGALIRAALRLGAACGRAPTAAESKALDAYANAAGLAFQVVDDVLDVEGSAATLGKTAGKDAAQGKPTFVALLGVAARPGTRGGIARRSSGGALADRAAGAPARANWPTGSCCATADIMYPLLDRIDDPAALRRLDRGELAGTRARAAGLPGGVGRADGRPPVVEPRHGRAHDRAALRFRHAARPDRLGRRPSDLRAQDADRPARADEPAPDEGRALGFSAPHGKRATTRSAPRIRRPRSRRRSAWRSRRSCAARRAASSR